MTDSPASIATNPLAPVGALTAAAPDVISTRMVFDASPARAWQGLMFYEQIEDRPPLHLRLVLPVPLRTEGKKSAVGDEARCIYESGHLIKRVTRIEQNSLYGFEVIEQELKVGRGMRLFGGSYTLTPLAGDRTEITLVTRYRSGLRPRWFWRPIESVVGHLFHRHILSSMKRSLRQG